MQRGDNVISLKLRGKKTSEVRWKRDPYPRSTFLSTSSSNLLQTRYFIMSAASATSNRKKSAFRAWARHPRCAAPRAKTHFSDPLQWHGNPWPGNPLATTGVQLTSRSSQQWYTWYVRGKEVSRNVSCSANECWIERTSVLSDHDFFFLVICCCDFSPLLGCLIQKQFWLQHKNWVEILYLKGGIYMSFGKVDGVVGHE